MNMQSEEFEPYMIHVRRHLHKFPELSFMETGTMDFIEKELKEMGLSPVRVNDSGIFADITGNVKGKTIAVRADMDALPVKEESGKEYRSENEGVMHACGHDSHVAMLLGLAKLILKRKNELNGTVRLLFQQAEEQPPGGAVGFIRNGVLKNVDYVLGQHIYSTFESGKAAIHYREAMANADEFKIKIHGKGGHGSEPEATVDALVVAANFITAAQTIVSRNIGSQEPAVVSFGTLNSGYRYNIIAPHAEMTGTVRTFSSEVQDRIIQRLEAVLSGICEAFGATYEYEYEKGYPVVVNDEKVAKIIEDSAAEVLGDENVLKPDPIAGGEDFAYYLNEVPGAFYFLGTKNKEKGITGPQHSPTFDIDEPVMKYGTEILYRSVIKLLAS